MKRNNRIISIILFKVFLFSSLFVFGQDDDIYSLTATGENMVVCGPDITFRIIVRNNTTEKLEDIVMFPGLPTGVTYVSGSNANMTEISADPEDASFQISDIDPLDSVMVSYKAKGDCRLIEYIQSGSFNTIALVNNNTRYEYSVNGTSKYFNEPNGSSSYNVAYADIELFVNPDDADLIPDKLNEILRRRISIKNSGIGYTESLKLYINYDPEIAVKGLYLTDSDYNVIEKLTPVSSSGNQFEFTLNNFYNSGDKDNLLEGNEIIYLVDSVKLNQVSQSAATEFMVRWGCDTLVCNPTDQEAEYAAYVRLPLGNPNIKSSHTVIQKAEIDSTTPSIIDFYITNIGKGNPAVSDAAYNIYFRDQTSRVKSTYQLFVRHQVTGELIDLNKYIGVGYNGYSSTNKYIRFNNIDFDIDGPGGLSDLDNDSIYDDLAVGDTLYFRQINYFTFKDDDLVNGTHYLSQNSFYCFNIINSSLGVYTFNYSFNIFGGYSAVSGKQNIKNGETANYSFTARPSLNFIGASLINLPNLKSDLKIIVPNGLIVNSIKNNSTNKFRDFIQVGDTIILKTLQEWKNSNYYISGGYFILNATMNCDSSSSLDQNLPFSYQVYFTTDSIINETPKLYHTISDFYIINSCLPCSSFETLDFTVERTSFGWKNPHKLVGYDDLMVSKTISRVNENTTGLKLDHILRYDTFKVSIKSHLVETADTFSNIHAKVSVDSILRIFLFDYLYAHLVYNGDTFHFNNRESSTRYFADGLCYYDVPVPLGNSGLPENISPDSDVEVILFFTYDKSYTKKISELGGLIYGIQSDGTKDECSSLFFNNLYLRNRYSNKINGYFDLRCHSYSGKLFWLVISNSNFYNEIRPYSYIKNVNTSLPEGFEFDTTKGITLVTTFGRVYIDTIKYSNKNRDFSLSLDGSIIAPEIKLYATVKTSKDFTPSSNYTQFYVNYEIVNNFDLAPELQSLTSYRIRESIYHYSPKISLSYNEKQEGYSNTVSWPVTFCNQTTNSSRYPNTTNVWVAAELKKDDSSTVLLGAVSEAGDTLPVVFYGEKDDIRPEGKHMLVQVGGVGRQSCKTFNLIATYKKCVEDRKQKIDLYSSFHCYNYPVVSDTVTTIMNVADKRNEILTGEIILRYKTTNIQWDIYKLSEVETELCESVPIKHGFYTTKDADMFGIDLWCELPKGVTLDGQPTYSYPLGTAAREIPASANLSGEDRIGWRLTSLTGGYLAGARTDTNSIEVNLSVTPSCGFNPFRPVIFKMSATTNCNDDIFEGKGPKINILGLELDSLSVEVNGGYFPACGTTSELNITVSNKLDKPSVSSMFEVVVPSGVSIIRRGNDSCLIQRLEDGKEHLYWSIPNEYLGPGESFEMTVPIQLSCSSLNFDELEYVASTSVNRKTQCITGGSCNLGTTTGEGYSRVIYEPVLDLEAICSENVDTENRWIVRNLINQTVTFTYQNGDETVYGTRNLNEGDSLYLVTPVIPELTINYYYGDNFGILIEPSITKRCGNNIDCKDFDFELIPADINCPGYGTGSIHVNLPDVEIYDYRWRDENNFNWRYQGTDIDLENVFASDYSLRVIILDRNGDFCIKRKTATISEPELHIQLETQLTEGEACTGSFGVVKLNGVLQEDTTRTGWYSCYDTTYIQVNADTSNAILAGYYDTLVVRSGEVVKTSEISGFHGHITVAGGLLFVQGFFKPAQFTFSSGTVVVNKSSLFDVDRLTIPAGCTFENYGILEAPYMDIQGSFANYYKHSSDTVYVTGDFLNYNEVAVYETLINNGNIYNTGDIEVYTFTQNNGSFENGCMFYTPYFENKSGKTFSNAGYLEIYNKFINQSGAVFEIVSGSEIVFDTLANQGDFTVTGDSCYCFTVFNLDLGSSIPPIEGSTGTCTTTCRYASGEADNATLVDETGTIVDSLVLTPGLHTIHISLNESCVLEEEIYIDGGLEIETNLYDSICPGGESYLACEFNSESDADIDAIYEWYPKTGIVNYDSTQDYQIVRPKETTEYTVTVTTENGCSGQDKVTIYVIDYQLETIQDKTEVCANDSISLTATTGNFESSFLWEPDELLPGITTNQVTISDFENPGEYTCWVTATSEEYGCELTDTLKFYVSPSPNLEVFRSDTIDTTYCTEADIKFIARGAEEYQWYLNLEEYSTDSVIDVHFTDTLSTLYVEGKFSETQCSSTSFDEEVRVVQKPVINVELHPGACIIPYQQLSVTGGSEYSWYPSKGLNNTTLENPKAIVSDTTDYYVQVTDSLGCVYLDSIQVYPILWPKASEDEHLCFGDTAQLNVSGGLPGSYIWKPAYALDDPNIDNPTTNTLVTTMFTVEAQDEYGCVNYDTVNVFVDPSCRCYDEAINGTTYQWTGAVDSDWTNYNNWTADGSRNNYPGLEPTDNILLDTASLRIAPVLYQDLTIKNLCLINGAIKLSDHTLNITGDATFIDGEVNSNIVEKDKFGLNIGDSTYQPSVYFTNTVFNSSVNTFNCSELLLNGSTFNELTQLEQGGSETVNCLGGNIYNGNTRITNSGSGILRLAFNTDGKPDVYNGNVEFNVSGSGELYPGASYTDTIRRDLKVNGKAIIFGYNGGITHICGEVDQFIGSDNLVNEKPVIRKLQVDKDPDIAYSKLVLDIPVIAGMDTSDYLEFLQGIILTDPQAPLYLNKNIKVKNASDKGYVEGPVVKAGNEEFVYPLGADGYYMPLHISGAETIDTSLMLYAEYVPAEQQLGSPVEPITSVSTCEYWKLYDLNSRQDLDVDVTISWSPVSCDVLTDLTEMQVVSWDSLKWLGKGNAVHTGTRITGGTLTNKEDIDYYSAFTFGSVVMADYGPTVGLSLNNYGAIVKVNPETNITVNGNILNERGKYSEGKIENEGKIYVKRDFTNNSLEDTVAINQGTYELFGSFQRLRGTQPATFSNLVATGHGRKELYTDVFINDTLYINDNNISTKRNSLHIRNTDPFALKRTTGYFSSSRFGGFLRRDIVPSETFSLNQSYLYPVGNARMFRPIRITPGKNYTNKHTFSVRFLPYNPSIDTLNTTDRAATVRDVNTNFYHVVESDYSTDTSIIPEPVNIRFYFNRAEDGLFQSLGHWDNEPEVLPEPFIARDDAPLWKKANPVKIYIDTTDILTPHSLELQDWTDFSTSNFALVSGAYVINTNQFGNPYLFNDQGVVYSMEGDAFINQQPLYSTGHSSKEMGQPISPEFFDSTEISNIMVIQGDAFSRPGKLEITTYADGTIAKDKETGYYKIYFIDEQNENKRYILSPGVYDVIDGTILILKSSEDFAPNVCPSDIKVSFTDGSPLVFSLQKKQFDISNREIISRFVITDINDDPILDLIQPDIVNITAELLGGIVKEGIYKFTIEIVDVNSTTQSFNGQFIVIE